MLGLCMRELMDRWMDVCADFTYSLIHHSTSFSLFRANLSRSRPPHRPPGSTCLIASMLAALLARQQTSAGSSAAAAAASALSPVRFVLASASPRRRELLENCGGPPFVVVPSRFSEDLDKASFASAAGGWGDEANWIDLGSDCVSRIDSTRIESRRIRLNCFV